MKILHILDHSLPLHSGYAFRSQNIFLSQQNAGLLPVVLTSPKHEESALHTGLDTEIFKSITYYRSGGLNTRRYPLFHEISLMRRLRARILEVARIERPDILHAHSPVLNGIPTLQAGHILGLPVVYEIRAFWEDASVDHGICKEGGVRYNLIRWLETRTCRKVNAVVPICQGLWKDLAKRKGIDTAKIHIVGNAIDAENFTPTVPDVSFAKQWGIDTTNTVIGFIGSFYHYEGLELLLKALPLLLQKNPGIKILLVGGGAMEKELRNLVGALSLGQHVVFTGRIPHEQIEKAYALVDILVFPRISIRLTEIVTPLKPLEAMAMRKPLIASDVGGHKELIEDGETGILFKAGNTCDFVEKTIKLLNSPQTKKRLISQAFHYVRTKKNWQENGKKYLNIYLKIKEDKKPL